MNLSGNDGSAPLHGAAFLGQEGAAKLLVEAGAKVNAQVTTKERLLLTPVLPSGARSFKESCSSFLTSSRSRPMSIKCVDGRPKVVALLKENGGKSGRELAGALGGLWNTAKTGDLAKLQEALIQGRGRERAR